MVICSITQAAGSKKQWLYFKTARIPIYCKYKCKIHSPEVKKNITKHYSELLIYRVIYILTPMLNN